MVKLLAGFHNSPREVKPKIAIIELNTLNIKGTL